MPRRVYLAKLDSTELSVIFDELHFAGMIACAFMSAAQCD
ncbi:hypothetical protein BTN50_0367 [Candidatus Enterovibrio altilux]|uniref:Uncharacterized protein n=1 Tax=Candidatus Enterovibrio altilux TaxID=1927128 RepID=A0A291B7C3_9GAMM|nr:hypothetical protein BTN50_0367 [Candidatus Enterovibrio luxaltus]